MKKLADNIKTVGLIANEDKTLGAPIVRNAAKRAAAAGRSVITDAPTAKMAKLRGAKICGSRAEVARQCDLLLVFGGDGTMLSVAREITGCRTPILAINLGKLGFLTAVPSDKLNTALKSVWAGDFQIESRNMIEASVHTKDGEIVQHGMNDFVISRGAASRMIELEVSVDEDVLTRYRCDGLIVSSPTGSTAYSLSAGGAIVSPSAEVFTITPICPHTLSNRSVVISLSATIKVRVVNKKPETIMASDGQVEMNLTAGDEVTIRRSRRVVRLIKLPGTNFFETLRQKLNWSGSNV